jgi:glycerophosphoryl diester phosphodiesterase
VTLFGHRGAAGEAPENTLGGFAHAWESGVRAFELDIHLSRDGQLVVIHDPTLERTTDGRGRVGDHTAQALSALDAASHFPSWPRREGVPLLEEVLGRYSESIQRWQLEVKAGAPERLERLCARLAEQIERFGISQRATVTSFDPAALEIMRRIAPGQRLGLIVEPAAMQAVEQAKSLGCAELCLPVESGSAALVRAAHAAGLQVTGWLGNSPEAVARLLSWGVEAITSDVPGKARQWIVGRGQLSVNG